MKKSNFVVQFKMGLIIGSIIIVAGLVNECSGQVMKNDTIYYSGSKFYANQVVRLAYGSSSDKKFAFVYCGPGLAAALCTPYISNMEVVINRVVEKKGVFWANGKASNGRVVSINIVGAVDNKEIKIN